MAVFVLTKFLRVVKKYLIDDFKNPKSHIKAVER